MNINLKNGQRCRRLTVRAAAAAIPDEATMTTYSTTHDGIARIVAGTGNLLELFRLAGRGLRRFGRTALASWRAVQQARADARARDLMLHLAAHDPRVAADLRAAMLRAEQSSDR
jgi:hypothetical protein